MKRKLATFLVAIMMTTSSVYASQISSLQAMDITTDNSSHPEWSYGGIRQSNYGVYGQAPPTFHQIFPINAPFDGCVFIHTQTGERFEGSSLEGWVYDGFPTLSYATIASFARDYFGPNVAMAEFQEIINGRTYYHFRAYMTDIMFREDGVQFDANAWLYSGVLEPVPAEFSGYLLSTSGCEYLTISDLAGFSAAELRVARNEIYARHGRIFGSEDLSTYFNSKSWYNGTISADNFSDSMLSEVELANINTILKYEQAGGLNAMTQDLVREFAITVFGTSNLSMYVLGTLDGVTYYDFTTTDLPQVRGIISSDGGVYDAYSYNGTLSNLIKLN